MIQPSIWEKESFYGHKDIIIIGSGLVGLWSAWYLKRVQPDLRILIVDRGVVPTGASTRNAGFVHVVARGYNTWAAPVRSGGMKIFVIQGDITRQR